MKKSSYYRNKADRLLQEYIRLTNKTCFVCGSPQGIVGHHFFTKASSNALRYYLPNIIALCQKCHCLIHKQPHLVQPVICFKMGDEWYADLISQKRLFVKANKEWYQEKIKELEQKKTEII